jgi:hypothetical protein
MSKKEPKKDSPPNESPLRKSKNNKMAAKFSPTSEDILDLFDEEDEPTVHFETQIKNKKWYILSGWFTNSIEEVILVSEKFETEILSCIAFKDEGCIYFV